jgi:hypothetical protein
VSDVLESVEYWLTDPADIVIPVQSATWESSVNGGVNWACDLATQRALDWADTDEWRLHVHSAAGLFADWTSPPLAAISPDFTSFGGEGTTKVGGTDKTSYLLTAEGLTMPAFKDAMADAVLNAIGAKAGITVRYLGTTPLSTKRLQWFFVQGAQETLGTHMVNILHKAACNYRIGDDGAMEIFQMDRDVAYVGVVTGEAQYSPRLANKYSQVVLQKYSQQQTEFLFTADKAGTQGGDVGPIGLLGSSISAVDASASGMAWYAAFYSGPNGTGDLVALFKIDPTEFDNPGGLGGSLTFPTANPALTALSVVWGAKETNNVTTVAAGLLVQGQPPSDYNYLSSFKAKYPDVDGSTRQRRKLFASPLWPTLDFVTANNIHRMMLWEANKSSEPVTRQIRFDPNTLPGGTLPADADAPKARFDTVRFSLKGNDISMTLSGFAVPW